MMKRSISAIFFLTALIPGMVLGGGNPHFVGPIQVKFSTEPTKIGSINVCWKEAGVGNNEEIEYTASAQNASATYVCVNNGGNCPAAANKISFNGPVSKSGFFSSGKNGAIKACLTIDPPSLTSFSCPGGQTATLSEVSYSEISVKDTTNDIEKMSPYVGENVLSKTYFSCDN